MVLQVLPAVASGFSCDVRKIEPYGAYPKVDFNEMLAH